MTSAVSGPSAFSATAIRSVPLGVIVTALVQSVLAGLGLWVSGIPHASLLTAIIFVLCIAQLGPMLILHYSRHRLALSWSGNAIWSGSGSPDLDDPGRGPRQRAAARSDPSRRAAFDAAYHGSPRGRLMSFGVLGLFVGGVRS